MTEIHLQCDDVESFSAFKYARLLIERAKDVADINGFIDMRLTGFSETEAVAIANLLSASVQQSGKRHATAYSLRTPDADADRVSYHIHDVKLDTTEWNEGKQEMHIYLEGHTLPAYAMQSELRELQRYLLMQDHRVYHDSKNAMDYHELLCESPGNAQEFAQRIVLPLLCANRVGFNFENELHIAPIQGSQQVYLQISDNLMQELRRHEIGTRGNSHGL